MEIPIRPVDLIFKGRREAIVARICVECKTEIETFRDKISMKEYGISGLCQSCQDDVFSEYSENVD
jgi:hypothetical protein